MTDRSELTRNMKITKGARFNASARLVKKERSINRNLAYASGIVIVVTLFPIMFPQSQFVSNFVSFVTISMSLFIIIVSLLHPTSKIAIEADQFHRCAVEIDGIRKELLAADASASWLEFSKRYDAVLVKYNINHDQADYDKYIVEHLNEFPWIDENGRKSKTESASSSNDFSGKFVQMVSAIVITAALSTGLASQDIFKKMYNFYYTYFETSE